MINVGKQLTCAGWFQDGGSAAAVAEVDLEDFGKLELLSCVMLSSKALAPVLGHPNGVVGASSDPNAVPDAHLLTLLTSQADSSSELAMPDLFTPLGEELTSKIWNTQPGHHFGDAATRTFNLQGRYSEQIRKTSKHGNRLSPKALQAYIDAVAKLGAQAGVMNFPLTPILVWQRAPRHIAWTGLLENLEAIKLGPCNSISSKLQGTSVTRS